MPLLKKTSPRQKIAKQVTRTVKDHPTTMAVAGLAAATAVGAAAWFRARRNADAYGTAVHVESDGNGAWLLRHEGNGDPVGHHASKRKAVSAAREYARAHSPSVLTIHKKDGEVDRRHFYAEE